MAYKPKNVAVFRDDSANYPKGTGNGRGPGTVPGTTGSNDRDSKLKDFIGGAAVRPNPDFELAFGKNDDNDPRKNENHGKASYSYEKPTL